MKVAPRSEQASFRSKRAFRLICFDLRQNTVRKGLPLKEMNKPFALKAKYQGCV